MAMTFEQFSHRLIDLFKLHAPDIPYLESLEKEIAQFKKCIVKEILDKGTDQAMYELRWNGNLKVRLVTKDGLVAEMSIRQDPFSRFPRRIVRPFCNTVHHGAIGQSSPVSAVRREYDFSHMHGAIAVYEEVP